MLGKRESSPAAYLAGQLTRRLSLLRHKNRLLASNLEQMCRAMLDSNRCARPLVYQQHPGSIVNVVKKLKLCVFELHRQMTQLERFVEQIEYCDSVSSVERIRCSFRVLDRLITITSSAHHCVEIGRDTGVCVSRESATWLAPLLVLCCDRLQCIAGRIDVDMKTFSLCTMLDIISTCANTTHLRQLYGAVVRCYKDWRRAPPRGLTDVIAKHVPLIARDSQPRHPPPATNSADFVLKKVVNGRGSLVDWVSCVPATWCSSGPSLLLCPVIPSTTIADTSQCRHSVSHPTHCSREQGLSHVQTATSRTDAVMETHEAPLRINSAAHAVRTSCSQSPGAAQPCHPALSSDTVTMARHDGKRKDCGVSELMHIRRNTTSSSSDSSQRSLQRSSRSDRSEMNQSSASEAENCVAAVQPRDCFRSNKTYLDRSASGGCEVAGFCEDVECGSSVHPARFCQVLDFLCASHPGNIGDGSSCKYAKTPHQRTPPVSNSFPQRLSEEDIRNVVRSFVTSNLVDDVIHRIIGREFDVCGS